MKIVHITYSYFHGGAGIACKRMVEAQRMAGIDAHVITQEVGEFPDYVHTTTHSWFHKKINFLRHAWEKFIFLFYESSGKVRFLYSLGNTGSKVRFLNLIQESDIIHFHWFNAGFISLNEFNYILKAGKPIIWTLHDMWAFTGGCHYTGDCKNYQTECGNCGYLKKPKTADLSNKIYQKKCKAYSAGNLRFTAPSNWMASIAKKSGLLKNFPIDVIANPISEIKIIGTKENIRRELGLPLDKRLILFGAFNLNHTRKGAKYLVEALSIFKEEENCHLMVFGKQDSGFSEVNLKTHFMGYSSDENYIRRIFYCADVFVSPSLEEAFGLTLAEGMSVGTVAVSFEGTGVQDIIDHKINGYLAKYKDSKDLAFGIKWCLENNKDGLLSENAIRKIRDNFSYPVIGEKFINYYSTILNAKSQHHNCHL